MSDLGDVVFFGICMAMIIAIPVALYIGIWRLEHEKKSSLVREP